MVARNTICLWYERDALEAARFYASVFPDSSVGRMEAPGIGEMHDGKLEFYSQQFVGGRSMLIRGTWTIANKDLHSYTVDRSIDGGRAWHTSFIAKVMRAQ